MNSSKIKVMVFDLGNVLLPFDFNIIFKSLNEIEAGLGDKFEHLYFSNFHFHRDLESSKISVEEFTKEMLSWLEYKITPEQFYSIYSSMFSVDENMISLLPKLKEKYKLVLLSNTNGIHQKYGWEKYDFLNHFDKLILSHEVGAAKPDIEIFHAVEKFTNEPSGNHFFIDDITDYVEVAKSIGWESVVFTGYEELKSYLHTKSIL